MTVICCATWTGLLEVSLIMRCSLTNTSYYFPKIYFKRLFSQLVPFVRVVALESRLLWLVQVVSIGQPSRNKQNIFCLCIVQHYAAFNIQQCCYMCTIFVRFQNILPYCIVTTFTKRGLCTVLKNLSLALLCFRCCNAEYSACSRKNK